MRRTTIVLSVAVSVILASGCGSGSVAPSASGAAAAASPAIASSSAAPSLDPWLADLAYLDTQVRASHPDPFADNPESAWVAKLDELTKSLPTDTPDQRIVGIASLVGLLDTHSSFFVGPLHAYDVLLYPFSDGWYVDLARDPKLVGARVVSIGGHPIAEVEAALRPLVPADTESGELDGLQIISMVEFLHGLGIVDDPAKPAFVFEMPDGTTATVDLTSSVEQTWERDLGIIGGLMGNAPEAVARRGEPIWTRIDKPTKTFVLSYNDYTEEDPPKAIAAMQAGLADGSATRVLVDMRYIRGGNGSLAGPLLQAIQGDPRVNRPGGLIVLTGRENVSAGTIVVHFFDTETKAVLVGEKTPARADNFLCECRDIDLPNSHLGVTVPLERAGNGDPRPAIEPDIPMALSGADFFAGRDPVLRAALALPDPPKP